MNKPNIIWIFLDQCRTDVLGCYKSPFVKTPNIDRLASSGIVFERAYCQNPVCVPSRVSMLSGKYCHQTGVFNNSQSMKPEDSLLLRSFLHAGYKTANVGKVHLGITPYAAGFQEHRAIHHDGTPHMRVPGNYPQSWPWKTFTADGFPKPVIYATDMCPREKSYSAVGVDEAIDLLTSHADISQPLLLRLSLDRPHTPVTSPKPYDTMYREQTVLPEYSADEQLGQPEFLVAYRHKRQWDTFTDDELLKIRYYYYGLVSHLDYELGRLLDALADWRDNTIILLTVDHGCLLGEHGLQVKGPHYYDETAHVPFLLSFPGRLPAGKRVTGLVEMVDLLPTLCELCEIPVLEQTVGHSLVPLINGKSIGRQEVYGEQKTELAHFVAIRTERYAYWRYLNHSAAMLFDMESDQQQVNNLMVHHPPDKVVLDLEQRIARRRQTT
jgi:arylsulfatase